jgi:hypothetical protein
MVVGSLPAGEKAPTSASTSASPEMWLLVTGHGIQNCDIEIDEGLNFTAELATIKGVNDGGSRGDS